MNKLYLFIPIKLMIAIHLGLRRDASRYNGGNPRNALAHESRLYKWCICYILFCNWYYLSIL
jgi:hypothetical protein